MGAELEGLGGKGKGAEKYKLLVIKITMANVKYSTGYTVNDTAITMHGVRWVPGLSG